MVSCPSEDSILDYLEGRIDVGARAEIVDHVRGCSDCRELLAEMEQFESGGTYGRYVAVRRIGLGAMGVVYEAEDPLLARTVALKVLRDNHPSDSVDDELYARLLREAKALARLAHPNVVAVYDVGRAAGRLFLAMEFIEGVTLDEWTRSDMRPWQAILDLYVQAGRGLAAAHDAGVVHRDFKPANVLVGADGRVCVSDFGLARLTAPVDARGSARADALLDESVDGLQTRAGTLLGSPAFMSPEQLAGAPADARSDVFSFCVSLWSSLYGERPFAGRTVRELRAAIDEARIEPSREGIAIPRRLRDVLLRGLRSSPAERPASMRELLSELEREKAYDGLTRAERILHEAEEFFRPHERARAVSAVAVSLLRGALGKDVGERSAKELDRPDLPLVGEVEITGEWLQQFMKALGPYRSLLSHLFVRAGFVADSDGIVRFEAQSWYPYEFFTLFGHQEEISDDAAFRITHQFATIMLESQKVPRDVPFGPAALERADGAFARGLRIRGRALERQAPGPLRSAGGSRSYKGLGPGRVEVVSSSPSRCAMSQGYFAGIAEYFGQQATLEHLEGDCRDRGATRCRYVLSWKG